MTRQQLVEQIFSKRSYLCVGLDTDISKIPSHLRDHPDAVFEFNKQIIDATQAYCVAYKINTAFYEALGVKGWMALEKTAAYIPSTHFTIADAKRGDIGNTSAEYAKAFFKAMDFDALTVAPYMGEDSIRPFLDYKDKWTIVLGLTSNPGASDFELQRVLEQEEILDEGVHISKKRTEYLYESVLNKVARWGTSSNLMFVVGATRADEFSRIREMLPEHFFLVPGVGAQGGSLKEVSQKAMNNECGLLVNASRAVIYASSDKNFAAAAANVAKAYASEMDLYLPR
ncbi:MAG TPA: orotidine-5'-phosphate decarboxylase [Flavisolibacter sp.]|nr:orotidine-5'-phosphate decarboxylase [Flavisolibacter sp.]